jgi:hypothetical protein
MNDSSKCFENGIVFDEVVYSPALSKDFLEKVHSVSVKFIFSEPVLKLELKNNETPFFRYRITDNGLYLPYEQSLSEDNFTSSKIEDKIWLVGYNQGLDKYLFKIGSGTIKSVFADKIICNIYGNYHPRLGSLALNERLQPIGIVTKQENENELVIEALNMIKFKMTSS